MDRMTAIIMAATVFALVGVVAYIAVLQPTAAPAGPGTVVVQPTEVTTDHWKVRVYLKEGVGPNSGSYIDGNVEAYLSEITDVYDIPSDAVGIGIQEVNGGSVLFDLAVDPDYMSDNGMPVYFVATATDYYKNKASVTVPKTAVPEEIDREHAITIKLDKVAQLDWSADAAYRGANNPLLRFRENDEAFKSIFQIKPKIDFSTDKATGVFIVEKVTIEVASGATTNNIDAIDAKIGSVEFEDVAVGDLPETESFDEPVTITTENPLSVEITVTTNNGQESDLSSGEDLLVIKLIDVLDNERTVTVKVA